MTYPLDCTADPDALGVAAAPTPTARVIRFPVRLRVALASIALPVIAPTDDEAAAEVERVRAACRFNDLPCGNCALCKWSRDDQATYCAWEQGKHRPEECAGFSADRFDMMAWHRITNAVEAVRQGEVA